MMDPKVKKALDIVKDAIQFARRDLNEEQLPLFLEELLVESDKWVVEYEDLVRD